MKTTEQAAEVLKISRPRIYARIARIDEDKPEDCDYIFRRVNGKLKRVFSDLEIEELRLAVMPAGRPKKVYSDD